MNTLNIIDLIAIIFFGGSIFLIAIAAIVFVALIASIPDDKFY